MSLFSSLRRAAWVVATVAPIALTLATGSARGQSPSQAVDGASSAPSSAPDVFIKNLGEELLTVMRKDKSLLTGDVRRITNLVDTKVLPHVNFQRMTASAVGRNWRSATPEQQKRLQDEFKTLLIYTYAGAVQQIGDQQIDVKPVRMRPGDTEVVVRLLVRSKGEPIQIDYRLEKAGDGWKIYDVNVLGAWLVQTYQSSFSQEVNASGIDGLIAKLSERNKQLAARKPA